MRGREQRVQGLAVCGGTILQSIRGCSDPEDRSPAARRRQAGAADRRGCDQARDNDQAARRPTRPHPPGRLSRGAVASPHTHEAAALLACGRGSALSHRSAASLWSLLPYPAAAPVWITTPPERNATRPRIEVIRARLDPKDLRRTEAMPLTSPPRTLLDMATLLAQDDLESLVAEANYRRLASEAELRDQVHRNHGRRGVGPLRRILDLPGGPRRTRSPAERQLLRLLRGAGIDGFETNARVHGYEVDFLWRRRRPRRRDRWLGRPLGPRRIRARSAQGGPSTSRGSPRHADHGQAAGPGPRRSAPTPAGDTGA